MRGVFSTAQKAGIHESLMNDEEEGEVSAFDLKTPGKGTVSKEINKIMTRSQKKRGKKANANGSISSKRRRLE